MGVAFNKPWNAFDFERVISAGFAKEPRAALRVPSGFDDLYKCDEPIAFALGLEGFALATSRQFLDWLPTIGP